MLDDLQRRLAEPTSKGLADAVSTAIRDGSLAPGTTLPPIRTVAQALGVSPTTVSAAWGVLARAGVIHADGRRGTVVADRSSAGPSRFRRALQYSAQFEIDLSTGLPDPALLPDLTAALRRLPSTGPLQTYLDEPVVPELRTLLMAGWPFPADDVVVADGAMDALDLITTTFVRFGDRVAVERLSDPPLLDLLEAAGAKIVPVDVDAEGPVVASLRAALAAGVRTVFLQPRAQHPTGTTISPDRADELASVIRAAEAQVVEVDFAGAVASTPATSLGAHVPERTLHVRGYSASHGPELRVAAIGGPAELVEALVQRRHLGQGWTSRLLQLLLLDLLTSDESIAQVDAARTEYAARRHALRDELAARGVVAQGDDGLSLWIPVASEATALVALTSRGIGAAPGTPYAVVPDADPHLCITAGLVPVELAAEVAEAIADAANPPLPGSAQRR